MARAIPTLLPHASVPAAVSGGRGWRRPYLPGRTMPAPETALRRTAVHTIAIVALVTTVAYLTWRVTSTLDLSVPWLSIPLVVLEIHAGLGLALFTFSLWDLDRRPAVEDVTRTDARVAVLIPTFNEGPEILLPTVAAAITMQIEHETWVLDDGNRPEIAQLATELGARYLARPTHEHAKAGNLNYALGMIYADFVAVLDADHVAAPDFLVRTLGYFDDEHVALVQTPQDFYNQASFEHDAAGAGDDHYHEQMLFYRILQPGKNRWNAAFWCGTGAVVRVSALDEIGGVATDTITEDIHTTIRLHRSGWRTVYHNEVLARGLAAGDADTYQSQRLRWGTGAMQVLRGENPLIVSGLSISQRLAYAATLLGWFDAWRSVAFLVLPIAVVLTGAVPIRADAMTFAVAFGATFLLQQLALRVLSRGNHRPVLSTLFELVRMTSNLRATATLLSPRGRRFAVTPKGRQGDGRRHAHVPGPLRATLIASVLAAAWFALTLQGLTPIHYSVLWAVVAAVGWMAVNAGLVFLAVARIRSARYAPERRASVRFDVDLTGTYAGSPCTIADLSLTGARITLSALAREVRSRRARLEFDLGGRHISIVAHARSDRRADDGRRTIGLEFADEITAERAGLALALFRTRALPVIGAAQLPEVAASRPVRRSRRSRPATATSEAVA